MHARYCSPLLGRFLNVDPKELRQPVTMPTRWNRYAYSANNPLKYTDPDGRDIVVQVHTVAMGDHHVSLRIEPLDQGRYNRSPFVLRNFQTGQRYATLGAGPPEGTNPLKTATGGATLVSGFNRDRDADLQTVPKVEEVVLDLGGRGENEVIEALIAADSNYQDGAPYAMYPTSGSESYNSNSYVSGLLIAVGIAPPELNSDVPGYAKPVPEEEFEPPPP